MSAFLDRHNEALSGYRDLPYFAPVEPPVCEAARIERDRLLAEDAAERAATVARRLLDDRAEQRARCTTRHDREIAERLVSLNYALAAARKDGFATPHADEIAELGLRLVRSVRDQKEQAHGSN